MTKTYLGVRGTLDFDPSATRLFNKISQKVRTLFTLFGYKEIILPILEEEGVFTRSVGETTDIVEKQIFKLIKRTDTDNSIVLRPEGTAQVIRYYVENSLHKQSDFHKLAYIGPMFRGERPQKGRLRQFYHIGVEAIGSNDFNLDAEVINLAMSILENIGISEKELKINSLGCHKDKDNFSKALKQNLLLKKNELCADCQRRLEKNPLRILDCKEEKCKGVVANLKLGQVHLCDSCKNDFNNLLSALDSLQIKYTYMPHLVRGLDYYTNTVFEITSKGLGSQDALGAGGRYNNLVKDLGGPDIPAIGFALGIERILLLLKTPAQESKISVFVAVTGKALAKDAAAVLNLLRRNLITCDMDYCGKSLKAQLRYAEKTGAYFTIILGEEEQKEGAVIMKDMSQSTQEKVKINSLITILKSKLETKNIR